MCRLPIRQSVVDTTSGTSAQLSRRLRAWVRPAVIWSRMTMQPALPRLFGDLRGCRLSAIVNGLPRACPGTHIGIVRTLVRLCGHGGYLERRPIRPGRVAPPLGIIASHSYGRLWAVAVHALP